MPILTLIGLAIGVIGVGLLYGTFDKIETLVDNPVIDIAIVAGIILVFFALIVYSRKLSKGVV